MRLPTRKRKRNVCSINIAEHDDVMDHVTPGGVKREDDDLVEIAAIVDDVVDRYIQSQLECRVPHQLEIEMGYTFMTL